MDVVGRVPQGFAQGIKRCDLRPPECWGVDVKPERTLPSHQDGVLLDATSDRADCLGHLAGSTISPRLSQEGGRETSRDEQHADECY
jgi:hypothetical protein